MPWRGAEFPGDFPSLGWSLLDWIADHLPAPNDENEPFILSDEQAQIFVRWYAIDPDTGAFVYRRGASRRSKGWGKSPLEGAKALCEFAGPVLFDGWDANGEPVGRHWGTKGDPPPFVQVAAVSQDQTENTYGALYAMLTANEGRAADQLGIDEGRTRLYLKGRPGRLEPVTASAGSREGQRVTYAVLDETHLWTPSNGGVKLAATLRRNVGKMGGRSYETTNSYEPGEHSVAEATDKAADRDPSIFVDAVEAPHVRPEDDDAKLKKALEVAYGDAAGSRGGWVDLDRLVREIRDPDTLWEDSERFYFNHNVKGSGKAIDPPQWAKLKRELQIPDGAYIGVGFDGSISEDCTVLYGCFEGHIFEIETWQRPPGVREWKVPRLDVHDRVDWIFDRYKVGRMLCDPAKWWTEIETWAQRYGEETVLMFDTNSDRRMAPAVDRFLTAYRLGEISHDGSPTLADHAAAAHLRKARAKDPDDDNRTLYTIVKGADQRKIDAIVGAVLAHEAEKTMPEAPPVKEPLAAWI